MDASSRAALNPAAFRVVRRSVETADTFTLGLAPVDGGAAFRFAPGQFNMLYAFGAGEVPISVSGDPDAPGDLLHTVRDVGAVTRALGRLRRGDVVGVRGPFGSGWPVAAAEGNDLVIVAGGIGLAPLRPVVYQALARRPRFGKVFLLYGARTPGDLLYKRELETWQNRKDLTALVTVDNSSPEWRGHVGVVTTLIPRIRFDPLNTVAMVCGPEVMMRFTIGELILRGLDPGAIHLSMERNMKCGVGLCGHCQFGPHFVCKDGPVFGFDRIQDLFVVREV